VYLAHTVHNQTPPRAYIYQWIGATDDSGEKVQLRGGIVEEPEAEPPQERPIQRYVNCAELHCPGDEAAVEAAALEEWITGVEVDPSVDTLRSCVGAVLGEVVVLVPAPVKLCQRV
jgi:hypothetical protein